MSKLGHRTYLEKFRRGWRYVWEPGPGNIAGQYGGQPRAERVKEKAAESDTLERGGRESCFVPSM